MLECWIGINFMDTEELGPAQGRLEAAIEALGDAPAEGVRLIDALNHLGILWANRGESEKALEHLTRAEALHRELASGGEGVGGIHGRFRPRDRTRSSSSAGQRPHPYLTSLIRTAQRFLADSTAASSTRWVW